MNLGRGSTVFGSESCEGRFSRVERSGDYFLNLGRDSPVLCRDFREVCHKGRSRLIWGLVWDWVKSGDAWMGVEGSLADWVVFSRRV